MHITKLIAANNKCFDNEIIAEFRPGLNLLCGINNAGKTALLTLIANPNASQAHRSIRTLPQHGDSPAGPPLVGLEIALTGDEWNSLIPRDDSLFILPVTDQIQPVLIKGMLFAKVGTTVYVSKTNVPGVFVPGVRFGPSPSPSPFVSFHKKVAITKLSSPEVRTEYFSEPDRETVFSKLFDRVRARIYMFAAERICTSRGNTGDNIELRSNAENLPEVLNRMHAATSKLFDKYCDAVRYVLPQIHHVSIIPRGADKLEIMIWNAPLDTNRDDLSVPLSQCGTGIGQILAILYVIMAQGADRTILIDEPNSFLHPGATRRLIDVLRRYPRHQYIISTHAPEVIFAAHPANIIVVSKKESYSTVKNISPEKASEMRALFGEIGAQWSDVFGTDAIVWVEGPTEVECLRQVLEIIGKRWIGRIQIRALLAVDDLTDKHAKAMGDIYRQLSGSSGLLPIDIHFVLDREDRTEAKLADLIRQVGLGLTFIPLRMIENYMLHADAITACIAAHNRPKDGPQPASVPLSAVEGNLAEALNGSNPKYRCNREPVTAENIHAAHVLEDLFSDLTDTKLSYRKTLHGPWIIDWICTNDPTKLESLAEFLVKTIGPDLLPSRINA